MALLSKVGLYRGKNLAALLTIYLVLAIGAVTMVVPFLMTLTTSVTNPYDLPQYNIIPQFLFNEDALFIKYLVEKYPSANYDLIKSAYRIHGADTLIELSEAKHPLQDNFAALDYNRWDAGKLAVAQRDWTDFWQEFRHTPDGAVQAVCFFTATTTDAFREFILKKYVTLWREQNPVEAKTWDASAQEKAAISLMNRTYGTVVATEFAAVPMLLGDSGRLFTFEAKPRMKDYAEFIATLPAESVMLASADADFRQFLREHYVKVEKLNQSWGTQYKVWEDVVFSNHPPSLPAQHTDWADFVTARMSAANVTLEARPSDADFRAWLLKQYDSLERINLKLSTKFQSLNEITFPDRLPADKRMKWSWVEFAAKHVPADHWKFPHPLQSYHDFLRRRYGTVEKLAAAYGQPVASFGQMRIPQPAFDRAEFLAQKGHWVKFFLTDNFKQVFRYIAVRGYALWNTVILVGATLIASLTINPLAAYALSRFRMRWSRAILILFLVPMAFPGEVAQIPSFILTRDLGLLNTYWALILPGLANGFGIFLLKGFFDGLPRELYEAAELDGASEIQIYLNVTYPLCKPILALTVLGVVIAAYSGFMWAFIVCPDQKMWTLAVWVFQFSVDAAQRGQAHLQMAALVLMSIPTLIIFLFTQKIIMKGIVLPTMK